MFKNFLRSLLVVGTGLLWSGAAHAEGNCPQGYYPIGGGATMGCAPIPRANQRQAPQSPPPQWESRWGAIASDASNGILGAASNKRSKQEASRLAMSDCTSQGGVNCTMDAAYDNQCAVVVLGKGGYNTPNAPTLDEAVEAGMKTCRDAGHIGCHVHYSDCSLPVRIR